MGIWEVRTSKWIKSHKDVFIKAIDNYDQENIAKLTNEGIDMVLFKGKFTSTEKDKFKLIISKEPERFYQQMANVFMDGLKGDGMNLSVALDNVYCEADLLTKNSGKYLDVLSKKSLPKKTASKKVEAETTVEVETTKVNRTEFPTEELTSWLQERFFWNHQDWLELLDSLRNKGYYSLTDSSEWQTNIGNFLESNRKH